MSRSFEQINRYARRIGTGVTLAAGMYAAPATATCDGSAIGARFSEAAKVCRDSRPSPDSVAPGPAVIASTVVIPDAMSPVSISMPGYRRRLSAAVRQVRMSRGVPTDALIVDIGRRYRIDPHLLASMMSAESAGNPRAVSNKGALGLMQVMPGTARSLGVRDPRALLTDRHLAISTGAAYLKRLQGRFGNNVPLVVAAYNAGPGAVEKYRGIPRYRETQGYVGKVLNRYVALRGGVTGATR